MTLGEHLEELRWRLVRSILALVIACIPCIWLAGPLLEWLARPMILALRRYGQPDSFLATGPVETFLIYVKVVVISGLILAAPYVLYEMWAFVAAGLYPREKRWVLRLVPFSVGLFLLGVAFMYVFVLLLSLNFLVGFSTWLPLPNVHASPLEMALLGEHRTPPATTQSAEPGGSQIAVVDADPPDPATGTIWFNRDDGRLKLHLPDGTRSVQLARDTQRSLMTTHFRISEYLTFVLVLTIAFGAAFQTPLVVLFLVRSGLVAHATLRKYRKVVIMIIVLISAVLAPPDMLSMILLGVPMYVLFEVGMLLARRAEPVAA